MIDSLKLELLFPQDGSTWTDVSTLIRPGVKIKNGLHGPAWQSVINTADLQLNFDETIATKFAAAQGRILARLDNADTFAPLFTGYIRQDFSQAIKDRDFSEGFSLTIYDNSFLLDEKISASIYWPASIGGTQYKICDPAAPGTSILHAIVTMAGYVSGVDPGVPTVNVPILQVSEIKGEATYREILDGVLSEHGYVLRTTAAGNFTLDRIRVDSVAGAIDLTGKFAHKSGLTVQKGSLDADGIEIVWAQIGQLSNVLLYQASLPFSASPPDAGFTGEPIAAGDYYPPDSDLEEIYQDFDTQWLDVPYITRQVRQTDSLKNKDISLINTSSHTIEVSAESGIATDLSTFEPKRARLRYRNTSGAIKKIFHLRIRGTALFRQTIKKTRTPTGSTNPREITTRYVFDSATAAELARLHEIEDIIAGFDYGFALKRADYPTVALGQIVKVAVPGQGIDSFARIVEIRETLDEDMIEIRAKAVTTYSAGTSTTTGSSTSTQAATQAELAARPTFEQVVNGFIGSGGTTTPDTPTITAYGFLRSIFLAWSAQTGLTGQIEHELQRAPDVSGSPGTYSTLWIGRGQNYIDQNAPTGGTVDIPTALTWFYRVRRIVNGVAGAWSSAISAQSRPAEKDLLAVGSVTTDKVDAGVLNALVAQIASYLIISSGQGWLAGKENGVIASQGELRAYLDQDEIALQVFSGFRWKDLFRVSVADGPGGKEATGILKGTLLPPDTVFDSEQFWEAF